MTKQRNHNEWFRIVSLGNRKSCPTCKTKLGDEAIWSWGEYVNAKWRTVAYFCRQCFADQVKGKLNNHTGDCGCKVTLRSYRGALPEWLAI